MRRLALRGTIGILALAGTLLILPFTVESGPLLHDNGSEIVRVNEACGQASECEQAYNYICVGNEDHEDYKCSAGCDGRK